MLTELSLRAIKATSPRSAGGPHLLLAVCLCHSFHRKMERQEMASCCETYKAGYSCIGFCSCFRASGLLCGDTAACTLVAEEPDHKSNYGQKGNPRFKQLKTKNILNYIIYRNMQQFKSSSVIQKVYFFFPLSGS